MSYLASQPTISHLDPNKFYGALPAHKVLAIKYTEKEVMHTKQQQQQQKFVFFSS